MIREKLQGYFSTLQEALSLAEKQAMATRNEVEFDFNGIKVIMDAYTNPDEILRQWQEHLKYGNANEPKTLARVSLLMREAEEAAPDLVGPEKSL